MPGPDTRAITHAAGAALLTLDRAVRAWVRVFDPPAKGNAIANGPYEKVKSPDIISTRFMLKAEQMANVTHGYYPPTRRICKIDLQS